MGVDKSTDLAVIEVDVPASEAFPLAVGDSKQLQVGDGVVAIGSPFGLEETVTSGIVSALHRAIQGVTNFTINDSIQTDAAINHGNSGGPLLNTQGQVVGVNAQIKSDSGGNEGVGFSIPSDTVKTVASQLIATGKAVHAYLGVGYRLERVQRAPRFGKRRLRRPRRPASKTGDVITEVAGTSIATGDDLSRAIDAHKPGDKVSVTLQARRLRAHGHRDARHSPELAASTIGGAPRCAPVAQWKSSGFLNRVHKFDSCRGHSPKQAETRLERRVLVSLGLHPWPKGTGAGRSSALPLAGDWAANPLRKSKPRFRLPSTKMRRSSSTFKGLLNRRLRTNGLKVASACAQDCTPGQLSSPAPRCKIDRAGRLLPA